jgi:hypothetical protein
VKWFKRSVVGLLPRRRNFNPRLVHVESAVDKVTGTSFISKYLGLLLSVSCHQISQIHSSMKLENVCYHSVQNLLSSRFLSKNLKIKIYRTIILPVVLYGCETFVADIEGGTQVEGV